MSLVIGDILQRIERQFSMSYWQIGNGIRWQGCSDYYGNEPEESDSRFPAARHRLTHPTLNMMVIIVISQQPQYRIVWRYNTLED